MEKHDGTELVIFDLDGTLIDTSPGILKRCGSTRALGLLRHLTPLDLNEKNAECRKYFS